MGTNFSLFRYFEKSLKVEQLLKVLGVFYLKMQIYIMLYRSKNYRSFLYLRVGLIYFDFKMVEEKDFSEFSPLNDVNRPYKFS